jgi:hypothetical protein
MADVPELKQERISPLEEVKMDAVFNFNERIRQQKAKADFEAEKAAIKAKQAK